jgi:hypothetical protein
MRKDKQPRRWLRAFPRVWRDRYGGELGALIDDLREEKALRLSDRIDILRSGLAMRRHAVKRRSVYGAFGAVVGAVCALVALALAGVFGPRPTTPGPSFVGRIVVVPAKHVLSPAHVERVIATCETATSAGDVLTCHIVTPSRAKPSGGSVNVKVSSQSGSS